jgi:hypothetical protein
MEIQPIAMHTPQSPLKRKITPFNGLGIKCMVTIKQGIKIENKNRCRYHKQTPRKRHKNGVPAGNIKIFEVFQMTPTKKNEQIYRVGKITLLGQKSRGRGVKKSVA